MAVARYLEKVGIRELLERGLPDGRTSPNQIPVVEMVLSFFATVLSGGRRFAHAERLRSDEVVGAILGVKRMPSAMTLTRYFGGFVRSQVEHLSEVLWQFVVARPLARGRCSISIRRCSSATGASGVRRVPRGLPPARTAGQLALVAGTAPASRGGGNVLGRPGASTWNSTWLRAIPRSRNGPSSRRLTPAGAAPTIASCA